jgi:hypothetical protein
MHNARTSFHGSLEATPHIILYTQRVGIADGQFTNLIPWESAFTQMLPRTVRARKC